VRDVVIITSRALLSSPAVRQLLRARLTLHLRAFARLGWDPGRLRVAATGRGAGRCSVLGRRGIQYAEFCHDRERTERVMGELGVPAKRLAAEQRTVLDVLAEVKKQTT
jgi:hypothetical protein